MRLSIFDHISPNPGPALGAAFREQIRRTGAPSVPPALASESGVQLSAELVRFLDHPDARPIWWVSGRTEGEATQFALRAIERAMRIQQARGRATQFVPVTIPLLSIWPDSDAARDIGSALARSIEHNVGQELLCRLRQRAVGEDAMMVIERFETASRGVIRRADLEAAVRGVYGDSRAGKAIAKRVINTFWLGFQIRANRVANDPGPWLLRESQKETGQLAESLASKQRGTAAEIRGLQNALDFGFASTIGLLTFAASSLALPPLSAVGLGMMLGGLTAFARARGRLDGGQPRGDWSAMADAFEDDELSPEPIHASTDDSDETRLIADAVESSNALHAYVNAARVAGLIPVIVVEQAVLEGDGHEAAYLRLRRFLGHVPRGIATLIVGGAAPRPESMPGVEAVSVFRPREAAIGHYIDRRMNLTGPIDANVKARLGLERTLTRLVVLAGSAGRLDVLETTLSALRNAPEETGAAHLVGWMQMRIRATFKLARDIILRESQAEMNADDDFATMLPITLALPTALWAKGRQPRLSESVMEGYLAEVRAPRRWSDMSRPTQTRLRKALNKLLELSSSRVWLVSLLPEDTAPYAHLIPEWPLLVRQHGSWQWTFHHDGSPRYQRYDLGLFQPSAGTSKTAESPTAQSEAASPLPPSMNTHGSAPTIEEDANLVEYLGDFTLARAAQPANVEFDGFDDANRATQRLPDNERDSSWETAHDVLDLFEALDEGLAQLLDGQLSVKVLTRCGLLPMMPDDYSLKAALNDDGHGVSRYVLAEAAVRIRQRIGVIDKFILWAVALSALSSREIHSSDIARLLVRTRGLRGRTVAEQHARLATRALQAELRTLCPSTRGADNVFRRKVVKVDDRTGLKRWGADLRKRADLLAWSVRDGIASGVVATFGWNSIARRLRRLALDGEPVFPTFAEKLAIVDGLTGTQSTHWSGPTPTVAYLVDILATPASKAPEQSLTIAKVSAMILLGLNGDGLAAAGSSRIDLTDLDPLLASRFDDAGPARRPHCLFVREGDSPQFLNAPPPVRGSVAVVDSMVDATIQRFPQPDALVLAHEQA
ncbi:MAG: hypothetical protein VX589_20315, partial [Myxococcota bacterium]|nr:hypothetical protein [Myxococcota bacterium]